MKLTYSDAGVDTEKESRSINALVDQLVFKRQGIGSPADLPGHFSGAIDFGEFYLAMCTDGVGTKMIVAEHMKKWDTVGIDCMAMNSNDIICIGAEPLAFVDYFAVDKYDEEVARQIGIGLNKGAELSNLSIIGGELATLPEIVKGFDLAGTCLGYIKKSDIITGQNIQLGDAIIGLESSGIHSNGLTLVRKILEQSQTPLDQHFDSLGRSIGLELLEPTMIYVRGIMKVLKQHRVHGMANITGGGIKNLIRMKNEVKFRVDDPIEPLPIFKILAELGNISDEEMYHAFNMGIGYSIVAPQDQADGIIKSLGPDFKAKVIGSVVKGSGCSVEPLGLNYSKY